MISVTITGGSRIKAALGHGAVAVAAAGYALYVHEGTSRMAARKFLEGPMAEMGESVLARIKSAVEAAL